MKTLDRPMVAIFPPYPPLPRPRLPTNLQHLTKSLDTFVCCSFHCFTRMNVEFAGAKKKLLFVEITARDGRTQKQQERPWLALAGLNSAEREMQLVASLLHPPSLISYLRITLPFIRSLLFPFSFFLKKSLEPVVRRRRRALEGKRWWLLGKSSFSSSSLISLCFISLFGYEKS